MGFFTTQCSCDVTVERRGAALSERVGMAVPSSFTEGQP